MSSQTELAERCAMDQGDIGRIERGSTILTTRTFQRIAEVLDATFDSWPGHPDR